MEKKKEEAKVIEIKFEPFEILHPSQRKKSQAYLVSKLRFLLPLFGQTKT